MKYIKEILYEQYELFLIWVGFYAASVVAMVLAFHGWTWLYILLALFVAFNVIRYTIFVVADTILLIEYIYITNLLKQSEDLE